MTGAERTEYRRRATESVRACVRRRLDAGQGFPSVRDIRRETGIASLATVSKYLHALAAAGEISLPRERYEPPRESDGQRILAVRRKLLRLDGCGDILLSLVAAKKPDGQVDVRVVGQCLFCGPRPSVHRVLSCTDTGEAPERNESAS